MRKPKGTRDVVKLADLAPRHEVRGGNQQRVFGAGSAISEESGATVGPKKTKDLSPKSPSNVKGGKPGWMNDNITLVRAAKPTIMKDLPPKDSTKVKGGRLPSP